MSIASSLRDILAAGDDVESRARMSTKAKGILKACSEDVEIVKVLSDRYQQDPDLFANGSLQAIVKIASDESTSHEHLRKLAASKRPEVPSAIARRSGIPRDVLEVLLESSTFDVLKSVALSPALTDDDVRFLLGKPDGNLLRVVLQRKGLERAVQLAFAQHPQMEARRAIASNSDLLDEAFVILARDEEYVVRGQLRLDQQRLARIGLQLTVKFVEEQRAVPYVFAAMVAGAGMPPDEAYALKANWAGSVGDLFEAIRLTRR